MPSNVMGNLALAYMQKGGRGGVGAGFNKFLKLEGAFKDAQRINQFKSQQASLDRQQQTRVQKMRGEQTLAVGQERNIATIEAANIRKDSSGQSSLIQIAQKASQLANKEMGQGAMSSFDSKIRAKFIKRRKDIALDFFIAHQIDPKGIFGLTLEDVINGRKKGTPRVDVQLGIDSAEPSEFDANTFLDENYD